MPDTSACEYWPSPKEQAVKTVEADTTPVVPQKSEAKPRVMPKKNVKEHENQVISVQVEKLDRLMDLVGEMVIAESMVATIISSVFGFVAIIAGLIISAVANKNK